MALVSGNDDIFEGTRVSLSSRQSLVVGENDCLGQAKAVKLRQDVALHSRHHINTVVITSKYE